MAGKMVHVCKGKGWILIQCSLRDHRTSTLYNLGSGSWLARANGAAAQTAAIQLHALTYNWTRVMQLANTPPLQSTTPGLHPVSIHQTSPPVRASKHPITPYYSIYRPQKDERLSWPSWLTCSRRLTHISGHPSAAGRAQDRESSPAKDRRSTTVPRHQLCDREISNQCFSCMSLQVPFHFHCSLSSSHYGPLVVTSDPLPVPQRSLQLWSLFNISYSTLHSTIPNFAHLSDINCQTENVFDVKYNYSICRFV